MSQKAEFNQCDTPNFSFKRYLRVLLTNIFLFLFDHLAGQFLLLHGLFPIVLLRCPSPEMTRSPLSYEIAFKQAEEEISET